MDWFQRIFNGSQHRGLKPPFSGKGKPGEKVLLSSASIRQLNRMRLNAGRFLPGYSMGARSSQRRKPAFDFREHRLYAAGDDVRFVDWKASARQEHIFVRQGEQPKEATVYLILDCSASMGWGVPSKATAAQNLAAALAFTALNHGDRLFFQTIVDQSGNGNILSERNTNLISLGPLTGKGQYPGLLKCLAEIEWHGEIDILEAIMQLKRQVSLGGMTIIISDLLDCLKDENNRLLQALAMVPAPTWDVVIIHLLHPEEIEPSIHGDFELRDVETGKTKNYDLTPKILEQYRTRMQEWSKSLELACVEANAFYVLLRSDWELDREVIPHLRDLNILTPS